MCWRTYVSDFSTARASSDIVKFIAYFVLDCNLLEFTYVIYERQSTMRCHITGATAWGCLSAEPGGSAPEERPTLRCESRDEQCLGVKLDDSRGVGCHLGVQFVPAEPL